MLLFYIGFPQRRRRSAPRPPVGVLVNLNVPLYLTGFLEYTIRPESSRNPRESGSGEHEDFAFTIPALTIIGA
jgi:hypothetical protein